MKCNQRVVTVQQVFAQILTNICAKTENGGQTMGELDKYAK